MSEAFQPAAPPPRPSFQFSLRTLFLLFIVLGSSLGVFGAWGILVFALVVGLASFIALVGTWRWWAYLLFALLCLGCLIGLLFPTINAAREAGYRPSCLNRMHQLGLALQNYESTYNGQFPPAYTVDKTTGKRLRSWRTNILPFMEYDYLYFQLYGGPPWGSPWDSPRNKALTAFSLKEYVCPSDPSSKVAGSTQTNYFAVVGPGMAWAGEKPMKLSDFGKDARNTIMLVEVANSGVHWAEPRDLELDDQGNPVGGASALAVSSCHGHSEDFFFVYDHPAGACVAMADGSVRYLPPAALLPENLPKLLRIGGCKQEDLDKLEGSFVETRHPKWRNIAALAVWLLSVAALMTKAVRNRKHATKPAIV